MTMAQESQDTRAGDDDDDDDGDTAAVVTDFLDVSEKNKTLCDDEEAAGSVGVGTGASNVGAAFGFVVKNSLRLGVAFAGAEPALVLDAAAAAAVA
jgi:hypothetical protein